MNFSPSFLAAMLAGAGGTALPMPAQATEPLQPTTAAASPLPVEGKFPSLEGATGWLNSPPLTPTSLRGKVVLVDFWTFSCINWLRTLPYVRAWGEKYKDQGLVVIGVHSPEFGFEKDLGNIRRAIADYRVNFPVAVDSNHQVWRAFNNEYWPALYVIDAAGRIRAHYFGEGDYEQAERVIQRLLVEAGAHDVGKSQVAVSAEGAQAPADWGSLKSGENYLGSARSQNFESVGGTTLWKHRAYEIPARLNLNHWALAGDWTVGREALALNAAPGRIAYRFHARDLHLVMGPRAPGTTVRFRVRIDGKPPGDMHGVDVDAEGNGTATGQRLYQLIRQTRPIVDRQFEIEFLDPDVEAFSFTFG